MRLIFTAIGNDFHTPADLSCGSDVLFCVGVFDRLGCKGRFSRFANARELRS